jgi:hypothetical protein
MPEEPRVASSPTTGAARDSFRTFVAFLVAFLFTKIFGEVAAVDLAGAQEAVITIIMSAVFAGLGKLMRNKGVALGKVI